MHPPALTLTGEIQATAVRLLAYICGIAGLAVLPAEIFRSAPVIAAIEPVDRPEWVTIERPAPAFEAHLPELAEEARYVIRRHARGGGRKDIISFGEPGRSVRYVMLEIYRPGTSSRIFCDPASEIACARARSARPAPCAFHFRSKPSSGARRPSTSRSGSFGGGHCVGFVRDFNLPQLQISGISCNMDTIVDRSAVSCMLDRLTLLSSGSDQRSPRFSRMLR